MTWAPWRRVAEVCRRGYDVMHFHTIWNPLVAVSARDALSRPESRDVSRRSGSGYAAVGRAAHVTDE